MGEHESTSHGVSSADGGEARIASAYDRWSEQYDRDANATRDLDAAVLRRAGFRLRGRDVVEIGCGTGKNTAWLAAEASAVTAMDFSEGMLARARARVGAANVAFVAHDVRLAWPIASASVDLVTCNLVLEHVRALGPVFAEAARVLRAGGRLFISELHPCRQLLGGQAHFTHERSGETTLVPAFRRSVSEFVNEGIGAGFALSALGEARDDGRAGRDIAAAAHTHVRPLSLRDRRLAEGAQPRDVGAEPGRQVEAPDERLRRLVAQPAVSIGVLPGERAQGQCEPRYGIRREQRRPRTRVAEDELNHRPQREPRRCRIGGEVNAREDREPLGAHDFSEAVDRRGRPLRAAEMHDAGHRRWVGQCLVSHVAIHTPGPASE